MNNQKKNLPGIVIFASGSGTNTERIIRYFQEKGGAKILSVFCNNPAAGVIQRTEKLGVTVFIFNKRDLQFGGIVADELEKHKPELIVLAGFLLQVPKHIIQMFPGKIINLHPALLPKYGGRGMYGEHVHRAVLDANERESGMTIHFVTENYDEGGTIFQATTLIMPEDTPQTLQQRIHALEHAHYPAVIERLLLQTP